MNKIHITIESDRSYCIEDPTQNIEHDDEVFHYGKVKFIHSQFQ